MIFVGTDVRNVSSAILLYITLLSLALLCSSCVEAGQTSATGTNGAARRKWAGNQWLRAHEKGHIPELPDLEERIKDPSRKLSVAMCAAMKAENMTDVREWLLYHRYLLMNVEASTVVAGSFFRS